MEIQWADMAEPQFLVPSPHPPAHCLCGRFGKWLGGGSYYNGNYDCYSYTVRCSRCGDITIECV